ncbi:MAG TPA: M1 family aminopeptidase [Bryobacteraceae bacterium]|nr:M1 family aminopeptidase [Bryobacteraceae bacterium]
MKRVFSIAMGAALAATALFAQQSTSQQPGSSASHIDVDGYTIDASVDPASQTLKASVAVRFVAMDDQVNSATFELNNNLNISEIKDAQGNSLNSSRTASDNTVRVTFPNNLPRGQMTEIHFVYDGRLAGGEDSPVYGIKFAAIQNDYAFLLYPARWFPINGYTWDRFTATMNITVPQGYTVAGSGLPSSKPDANGGTIFTFEFNKPSFPGDIAVMKGDPTKVSSGGVTTTLWFRGPQAEFANAYGERTAQMLEYFVSLFGLAPYANLTVVETADGAPNGYSAPGLIFLNPRAIAKEVNDNVLANQIARQWWEINVSPINRNHIWLENGMALYSEGLWAEHDKGPSALEQRMHDTDVTALTVDEVPMIQAARLDDYSPEYWALTASKGAAVMSMLRSTIGDDKFFAAIKDFLKQNAWKSVSTADFRTACEAASGQELRYFFVQWVENNLAPEFKLEYTIFRTQKGFRVQGKITQDLDTFRMPVDLRIETEGNPEEKRVEVMGTSSEFSVETFGKPKSVIIDPGNKVLRMSPKMRVDVAIRKGEQFVQIGEFAEALKEYQRALDTQKTSSMAHYRVAEVFFLQHNYQSAANEFREALNGDNDPKWIEVWSHIYLGKVFDLTGQRERAVNEYTLAQRTRDNTQGAQEEIEKYLHTPYSEKSKELV